MRCVDRFLGRAGIPRTLPALTRRTSRQPLMAQGLSPNAPDESSYTALHAAASWARPEVLRWLVGKGGNINVVDDDGDTPLFACETRQMAELCVELGADPPHRNHDGFTVRGRRGMLRATRSHLG